jgi:uncharacterized damage-inducible protein DinB
MSSACTAWMAELEAEARATAQLLDAVPENRLAWRPHPKSFSLGQLALHVASLCGSVANLLANDAVDAASVDFAAPEARSVAELRARHELSIRLAREQLDKWSSADLEREWRLTNQGRTLMAAPRGAMARSLLLNHLYHHRGQLTVYLRLLDQPVPSTYGPSADINPLA